MSELDGFSMLSLGGHLPGRSTGSPTKDKAWCSNVKWAALDLSGPYRRVYDIALPNAVQVADPFHVVKVRHEALCVRGRVRDPPCWSVVADR